MNLSRLEPSDRWRRAAVLISATALTVFLNGCRTPYDGHHHYHPEVSVPDGQAQAFRVFAEGVQVYAWTGTRWAFSAPEAQLHDGEHRYVGRHFKDADGPTWEGKDGSKVVGRVVTKADAYKPDSIPHLVLKTVASSEKGIFSHITYIQRVDTLDGVAPAESGKTVGQEARVKYSAEYVFYRKTE